MKNIRGDLSKTRDEMEKHKLETHPTRVTTKNHKRCYVCDLEVNDIMELMSHRKEHHPPNKKCRNLGTCRFGERCWYAHEETETDEEKEPRPVSFECNVCGDVSRTRDEMKQHRKRNHPTKVRICEKFITGICVWSDDVCWYKHIHEDNSHPENKKNDHQILPPNQP